MPTQTGTLSTDVGKPWEVIEASFDGSSYTRTLKTSKRYLDRDIKIDISMKTATFANITTATSGGVPLVTAQGYTGTKSISAFTIPASKTLSTLTLTAGTAANNTIITTMNVNNSTAVQTLNLTGNITTLAGKTGGLISTYSGASTINKYTNTGNINEMIGARTIIYLGSSDKTTTGTLNISDNTKGTVNIWGGKTKDKGVSIEGHVVTVDGTGSAAGTTVTNSSGDLITATPNFTGGALSISASSTAATGTNITIAATTIDPGTGVAIDTSGSATPSKTNITYNGAVNGWVKISSGTVALTGGAGSSSTLSTRKYYATGVTLNKGNWFNFTNAITETMKIKYNSDTNAIDFIFD